MRCCWKGSSPLELCTPKTNAATLVLIFGVGLIGKSVLKALVDHYAYHHEFLPSPWAVAAERQAALNEIAARVQHYFARQTPGSAQIALLWSAGKAGFSAT